jgi:uncharacterized protein (DUF1778 family)
MKSRKREPGATPRTNALNVRYDDREYYLIIDAAAELDMTPSAFQAMAALERADKVIAKSINKRQTPKGDLPLNSTPVDLL